MDEKKDLQVLFYAKERYELFLSGCENLAINDSWRCVLKTKRIEQTDTLETLKLIVCDDDVWNLSSDFSNKTLVDRCDRLKCANGMDTSGLKSLNHLTDVQMTYVSVGAIVAFIFLVGITIFALFL
uniref:Uncharacterized protein n=1 Tax=Ditylenchus dipsaci TaxID=166011 RepID=A0A915E088_9BILA